jgi:GntR family transcriptional regulator / MocR family aminotransferase
MPLARRLQLLAIAQRSDALIIEDDYDSEYQLRGQPIASLQGLDREQSVAYVGTFSKTMAPGVRAAFLVIPERYATLAHTMAMASGQLVSIPIQLALADFLNEGGLQRHVKRLTADTSQRMTQLVQLLRAANKGIAAVAISSFCHVTKRNGLLLGTGLARVDEIKPAVKRLVSCLASLP